MKRLKKLLKKKSRKKQPPQLQFKRKNHLSLKKKAKKRKKQVKNQALEMEGLLIDMYGLKH